MDLRVSALSHYPQGLLWRVHILPWPQVAKERSCVLLKSGGICSSPHSSISVRLQLLLTQWDRPGTRSFYSNYLWHVVCTVCQVQCLHCFLFFTSKILLISSLEASLTTGLCHNGIWTAQNSSGGWPCRSRHPFMPLRRIQYLCLPSISYDNLTLPSPGQMMALYLPLWTEMENGLEFGITEHISIFTNCSLVSGFPKNRRNWMHGKEDKDTYWSCYLTGSPFTRQKIQKLAQAKKV